MYFSLLKHLIRRYISVLLLTTILGVNLVFAQQEGVLYTGDPNNLIIEDPQSNINASQPKEYSPEEIRRMEQMFQQYQQTLMNGWESQAIYTQAKLIKNKRDLNNNLQIFSDSDQKIKQYNELLKPLEQKITTLKDQLAFLDEQIGLTQYKITNVTQQIIEKQDQIKQNMEDIERAKTEVQNQEKILVEYVKLIYAHEQQYYDLDTKSINDLKLLLADQSISKTLSSGEYMQIVQRAGQHILDELKKIYMVLAEKEVSLEDKTNRLQELKKELEKQQTSLQEEQIAKKQLLDATQGDEAKYQALLLETQQEKEQAAQDIEQLQTNIASIEKQLEALQKNSNNLLNQSDIQEKAQAAAQLLETNLPDGKMKHFPWPVAPTQGISAYFHDENYIAVFGVDHGAVDIPIPQGTEIHAPADAYVYKAKDNGYGYSYIILAHRGNFLTLYGHVSKILVQEGQVLHRGDVIGLSGGAPGSRGAGWRTTGPHLHFEIWKDGKKVDPLIYLDLSVLPMDKVRADKIPQQQIDVDIN